MALLHGVARWPGAENCEACCYTISQGYSPGTAIFRMSPNASGNLPAETGDLVFEDGLNRVVVPDCKVTDIKSQTDGSGTYWSLEIVDRRWKWRELGAVNGCYNQLDPYGKLIPWTIRSPRELAEMLLKALGETRYSIDLPDGITRKQGEEYTRILRPGELFPASGTNPCFNWEAEPPARALQNLCDLFGRRIVYQLSTNSVLITIAGRGAMLPQGLSTARHQPSVKAPERPSGVGVIGAPTRCQMRLLLEPVGKEWDGSYRPIDELSYSPVLGGATQQNTATLTGFSTAVPSYKVYINDVAIIVYTVPSDTDASMTTSLAAAINNNPEVSKIVKATAAGGVLTVEGKKPGDTFKFETENSYPPPTLHAAALARAAARPGRSWANCPPPTFWQVNATDRLNKFDAQKLAQESVWKCYRIVPVDPSTPVAPFKPLEVPGYGVVDRRQQIVLQDTQVEQVTPQANDPALKDRAGKPFTVDLYNGFSRDKPAAVYGSAITQAPYALYLPTSTNTPDGKQYFAGFSVNEFEQMIVFSDYVYLFKNGEYQKPSLVLQTGVQIRNAESNQFECYVATRPLENAVGTTNFLIKKYPDVQLNIVGVYDEKNRLLETKKLEEDAVIRAKYYLDGLVQQYPVAEALTEEYNGFYPIDLDGAISQVTWNVDESGCSTSASRNSEHNIWVAPYPARRRAEGLPSINTQRIGKAMASVTDAITSGISGIFGRG